MRWIGEPVFPQVCTEVLFNGQFTKETSVPVAANFLKPLFGSTIPYR